MRLAIGAFTDGFMGGAPAEGIRLVEVDPSARRMEVVQTVGGLFSPSFLCRHPQGCRLYAAERRWSAADGTEGALMTFAVDGKGLTQIDRRRSGGGFTAHVQVSPDARIVVTSNPMGPTVAMFTLDADGVPNSLDTRFRYEGRGARERQSAPWPHSAWFEPEGRRVFVCDLGLDRIMIYDVPSDGGPPVPGRQPFAQVGSGAGARHMAVSRDGRHLYVANELDGTIAVFAHDPAVGSVTIAQTIASVTDGSGVPCQPAEIVLSPDGRHLYVTNRGPEQVGIFAVDAESGAITPAGFAPTLGKLPRHIALSPDGLHAIVSNQLSGDLLFYDRDPQTGALEPSGMRLPTPSPSCVVFL